MEEGAPRNNATGRREETINNIKSSRVFSGPRPENTPIGCRNEQVLVDTVKE